MNAVMDSLPPTLTEEDFAGILKLSLLTECATDSYAAAITTCAANHDAPWLARFNQEVWVPDERTHYAPYKMMLMDLGESEADLDREIEDTRNRQYIHYGGPLPIHMTTFAMIQEYLTDSFHGLIAGVIRPAAPQTAAMIFRVKKRETLHCVWYRDMTALQVEANPAYVAEIAEQILQFHMPSRSLLPGLHEKGPGWQVALGARHDALFKGLFRLVQEMLGNVRLTGELVMRLAAESKLDLGPISARQLDIALRRLGGPGYGIIGEAALERAGLGYMFKQPETDQDRTFGSYSGVYEKIRGLVRNWVASQLPEASKIELGSATPG